MTRRVTAVAALICFSISSLSCFSERGGDGPVDVEGDCSIPLSAIGANKAVVAIRDFTFFPDTLRVRPGTEITWVNCETAVQDFHTSTASTGAWSSGAINRGEFFARRFDNAGSFEYFCEPHPFMRATVIVQ